MMAMEASMETDAQRVHDAASVLASLASSQSPPANVPSVPAANISPVKIESDRGATPLPYPHTNGFSDVSMDSIKPEHVTPSLEDIVPPSVDEETAKAIAAATNEYNTRVRVHVDTGSTPEFTASELSEKVATKKRQAPSGDAPGGVKKPPPKKRKSEAPSDRATPVSARLSPTPSVLSSKPSKAAPGSRKSKASKSATPQVSSNSRQESPDSASEASDGELYCICRKPDNHTWMIGCDGGCEDWFHGKCVNIHKEDEKLIDKYICPKCCEKGKGPTTWKPMCRREGCRKPARLKKGAESKYCSQECGILFMQGTLKRAAAQTEPPTPKRRQKAAQAHTEEQTHADIGPLGGTIRAGELKALALSSNNIDEFRSIGGGPFLTPPPSAVADGTGIGDHKLDTELNFTENEENRLAEIASRQAQLRETHHLLKDRGTFVTMMRARVPKIAQKLKQKDACGFDAKWSLDDISFKAWRESEEGKIAFETGLLEVPELDETNTTICVRKGRCGRHGSWQKLVYSDFRFEMDEVGNEKRRLDAEEKIIRETAAARPKNASTFNGLSNEAWVEVVPMHKSIDIATPDVRETVAMDEDPRPAYQKHVDPEDVIMAET